MAGTLKNPRYLTKDKSRLESDSCRRSFFVFSFFLLTCFRHQLTPSRVAGSLSDRFRGGYAAAAAAPTLAKVSETHCIDKDKIAQ